MAAMTKKPPKQKPRYWNEEEDSLLRAAIKEHGTDGYHKWKEVAKHVPNRTYRECMQRWTKVLAPGLKKGKWSTEEDEILRRLVQEQLNTLGESSGKRIVWNKVASGFKGRSCKQCRERWINHLDPTVKKTEWTHEEDLMLLQYYETMPSKWAKIARQIPGRTENMVKVRWNALNRQAKKRKQNALYYSTTNKPNPTFPGAVNGSAAAAAAAAQNYNQFYINNQISLNLGQGQSPTATNMQVPRLSYTEEMRKNSLYLFPGTTEIPGMPVNMNVPGMSFVKSPPADENRKLSAILNNIPNQNGLELRANGPMLKPGLQGSPEDFTTLRRTSSLAQIKALQDKNGERRLSFSMNGFPMDEHTAVGAEMANANVQGRRLSTFLYQDLVRNINHQHQLQQQVVNPGHINLPNLPNPPPPVGQLADIKRARVAETETQG